MQDEETPELKAAKMRRSVKVAQIGVVGFRVESTTNFLDVRCGSMLQREELDALIARGVNVTSVRNK